MDLLTLLVINALIYLPMGFIAGVVFATERQKQRQRRINRAIYEAQKATREWAAQYRKIDAEKGE